MARLILDAMGGDFAPRAVLEGVIQALPELQKTEGELILVGDETVLRQTLSRWKFRALARALAGPGPCRISIRHAPENIDMADSIRAVRSKPRASINVGCELARESYAAGAPAAFISAGHSGAVMASALLHMGRLKGIERPAIAVKLPTLKQDGCVLLDVGANVDCKPGNLAEFAMMGAVFAQTERKSSEPPRIGVLSNGEERSKGNELTRAAAELIEKLPCFRQGADSLGSFVGYVEGKEIFKGQVDVVVADGFVGNVVLKSLEGLGSVVSRILKDEVKSGILAPLGFLISAGAFRRLKRRLDYAEYGAAPLLGVAGYAFICHGRSNPKAIKNALLRARSALQSRFVERLESALLTARVMEQAGRESL